MKNFPLSKIILLTLLVATSCTKQSESNLDNDSLNSPNKISFQNKAETSRSIVTLKEDENFTRYNKKLKEYTYHFLSRKHIKGEKLIGKVPKDGKAALAYYTNQGFQDPEAFMRTKLEMIYYYTKVLQSFPELKQLNPNLRDSIFKEAGPIKFTSEELLKISTIVKANKKSYQ